MRGMCLSEVCVCMIMNSVLYFTDSVTNCGFPAKNERYGFVKKAEFGKILNLEECR